MCGKGERIENAGRLKLGYNSSRMKTWLHLQANNRRFRLNEELAMKHPLHRIVGQCISSYRFTSCRIIKDHASGGQQNIPLFCSKDKSNKTEYCNIDLLILEDSKIRVIIEIEETDITPTQICGKFLTSALSSYFIHESENNNPIRMSDSVLFVQILNTSRLKERTAKLDQWKNLEKSIRKILPIEGSRVRKYKLLRGNVSEFKSGHRNKCTELITYIKSHIGRDRTFNNEA